MTLQRHGDNPPDKPPNKKALSFGLGAIGLAIGTILTAGGQAGVDNGTIRLAIAVFGVLGTLALIGGFALAWNDGRRDNGPRSPSGEKQTTPRGGDESGPLAPTERDSGSS